MSSKQKIKIACLSDTHGNFQNLSKHLKQIVDEKVDLVIHAGDICGHYISYGERPGCFNDRMGQQEWFIKNWIEWCKKNPQIQMVMTPGNHDFAFEHPPKYAKNPYWDWAFSSDERVCPVGFVPAAIKSKLPSNLHVLNQEGKEILGYKVWASPFSPNFWSWGFNFPHDPMEYESVADEHWGNIPSDTDILITHGPPSNILDVAPDGHKCGCYHLKKQFGCGIEGTARISPLLSVFGHIHSSRGTQTIGNTTFINASMCDERNRLVHPPLFTEL